MKDKQKEIEKFVKHFKYMSKTKPFSMYYFLGWDKVVSRLLRFKCFLLGHKLLKLPTKSMIEPIIMNGDNWQVVCQRCGKDLYFIKEGVKSYDTT